MPKGSYRKYIFDKNSPIPRTTAWRLKSNLRNKRVKSENGNNCSFNPISEPDQILESKIIENCFGDSNNFQGSNDSMRNYNSTLNICNSMPEVDLLIKPTKTAQTVIKPCAKENQINISASAHEEDIKLLQAEIETLNNKLIASDKKIKDSIENITLKNAKIDELEDKCKTSSSLNNLIQSMYLLN